MKNNQGQATGRALEKDSAFTATEAQHQNRPQSSDSSSSESTKKRGHPQTLKQKWLVMSLPNKLTAIFTALLFVATTAYAIFSGYQLRVLQRQLDEMKGSSKQADRLIAEASKQADSAKAQAEQAQAQTTKMGESLGRTDKLIKATADLAKESKRSADIARESLDNAKRSLELSERSVEIQERPWVGITQFTVDITPLEHGKPMTGTLTFSNSGRSPAFDVEISSACSYDLPMFDKAFILQPAGSKGIMMPGTGKDTSDWNCILRLTPQQYSFVRQEIKKLYVYGQVIYKDAVGPKSQIHVTRFCGFWKSKSNNFADCPILNSAD